MDAGDLERARRKLDDAEQAAHEAALLVLSVRPPDPRWTAIYTAAKNASRDYEIASDRYTLMLATARGEVF